MSGFITIAVAFAANLLIAVAKTFAAAITGSASLVAEAAHSWADTGNEIFLVIAERRSMRKGDSAHPLGYGKEAYIWSMFAAFGLFTAGAVVSIQHGVQELLDPEPADNYAVAYVVLALSFALEGVSFVRAYRQAREAARSVHPAARSRGASTVSYVLDSSNPTLRAVFAEDAAALIGLTIAFLGVLLHQLTGNPFFDATGSILVGVLLAIVAVILINRNRRFLVGEAVDEGVRQFAIGELLKHPDIERVTYLHIEFAGPGSLFLVAAVDLAGDLPEATVAHKLRQIEDGLQQEPRVTKAVLTLSTPDEPSIHLAAM